ncbi:hypothetical protein acsn021_04070 [Anaerocolumna cellulosilytica]|uniref:Uncharacterized protein n=1 Tax=Anaerocolumna cellulosilytica TaxID=433286 RepID=A0A6S6R1H3_9FIRM|nr:hypothetical protein acsn021_04070 [Anaerocolumna cellulosilytica]
MPDIEKLFKDLTEVTIEKKQIVEKEQELKSELIKIMEADKINLLENARIKINYVKSFNRCTVNSELLKRDYPEVAKICMKTTFIDPFLKVKVI